MSQRGRNQRQSPARHMPDSDNVNNELSQVAEINVRTYVRRMSAPSNYNQTVIAATCRCQVYPTSKQKRISKRNPKSRASKITESLLMSYYPVSHCAVLLRRAIYTVVRKTQKQQTTIKTVFQHSLHQVQHISSSDVQVLLCRPRRKFHKL